MFDKICFSLLSTILLTIVSSPTEAQQLGKIPRIGFQSDAPFASIAGRVEGFRQGLRELGYVEGKDIVIEWRSSERKLERRPEIAAELVRLKPDVIVSGGPTVTRALREITTTIAIVMGQDTDPVGNGFVASLAKPGGNITGLSKQASEMSGRKLGLMKEIVPKLSRMAIIGNSTVPGDALALRETVLAAGAHQIYLIYLDVQDAKDIEPVIRNAAKGRADALMVLPTPILNLQRQQVIDLVIKHRLPATYSQPEYVEAGGFMTMARTTPNFFVAQRHMSIRY